MSYDFSYIWNLKQQKTSLENKENRLVVARGWGWGRWEKWMNCFFFLILNKLNNLWQW